MEFANSDYHDNVQIIYGRKLENHWKEYAELMHYESGQADIDASKIQGLFDEPWLNVINACESAVILAFEQIVHMNNLRDKIHGETLDIGAGTCWLTAKVSLLQNVNRVFAVDLSEKFLCSVGIRILKYFNVNLSKISFVISDFNDIPLEDETIDCAFLFACIHHSLSPIKTIQEVGRCLKKGGAMMILENPCPSIKIERARKKALELSKNVTEVAYTTRELEYLIKVANIGKVKRFAFDILSRAGIKMGIRKVLRKLGIEDLLINPPTYLFLIEKA